MPLPPMDLSGNKPPEKPDKPPVPEPIDLSADPPAQSDSAGSQSGNIMTSDKIRQFGEKRHADTWSRSPNVTGTGAIHCKIFHAKLREDAIEYIEKQINEWLDKHPEYEVKYVTSSIGDMKTKTITEQALFVTIWV